MEALPLAVAADRPARHARAVAFACDEGYAPFAALAAAQVAALSPARAFDVLLCGDPAPALPPSLDHLGIRRVSVGTGGLFDGLRLDARRTASAYLRLALPLALPEYDRLLYLDSDVFVQGGDWGALLGVELGGRAVGAVRDNVQWRTPRRRPEQFRRFDWPAAPYLNSGLLLVDGPTFRDADLLARAVALGRRERDRLVGHDQTLLNCLLRGDWTELSPLWNWQYTRKTRLVEAAASAHLVHFIGPVKPWADPEGQLPPRFAAVTAAFLARHFPDRPPVLRHPGPARDAGAMRGLLLRNWQGAARMAAYLGRFPDDLASRPAGT